MRLTAEQIEKQILEGKLTVSGGKDGNPPDKIVVVSIDAVGDDDASALLSKYCPDGFQVVGFADGRVILSNYGSNYKTSK